MTTAAQLTATLLANGPYTRSSAPFRLLRVAGPDAAEFLQRLCSQDVQGLAPGELRPAAFLDAKGKVLATVLVGRSGDTFWLETQTEQAERLAALLERYHFSEQLTLELLPAGPCDEQVEVAVDGGSTGCTVAPPTVAPDTEAPDAVAADEVTVQHARRGVQFTRRHGRAAGHGASDAKPLTMELAECARMLAGIVRVGVDTEASTLALEAELDDHCSTTKGCYTGQEIVARIHTYGRVNRRLCLLQLAFGPAIEAPMPLHEPEDQIPVGRVMHAVSIEGQQLRLGLGYLPKDFQAIGTKLTLADGAVATVIGFEA